MQRRRGLNTHKRAASTASLNRLNPISFEDTCYFCTYYKTLLGSCVKKVEAEGAPRANRFHAIESSRPSQPLRGPARPYGGLQCRCRDSDVTRLSS